MSKPNPSPKSTLRSADEYKGVWERGVGAVAGVMRVVPREGVDAAEDGVVGVDGLTVGVGGAVDEGGDGGGAL